LNRSPWHAKKLFKKISKHGIFFALSFLVGNVLLSYLICWQALYQIITDPPAQHVTGWLSWWRFRCCFTHLCAVSRAGLHFHLSVWPAAIAVAR